MPCGDVDPLHCDDEDEAHPARPVLPRGQSGDADPPRGEVAVLEDVANAANAAARAKGGCAVIVLL